MIKYDRWFPTVIGYSNYEKHEEIKKIFLDVDLEYKGIGFSKFEIHKDERFKDLNLWITDCVRYYVMDHQFSNWKTYEAKESWVVDMKKNTYSDLHAHPGYTISCVYYAITNEDDAGTIFKSPVGPDMKNPLNIKVGDAHKNHYMEFTYPQCVYRPVQGNLLIFRSYNKHSTDYKTIDDRRVIFSYNFDPC